MHKPSIPIFVKYRDYLDRAVYEDGKLVTEIPSNSIFWKRICNLGATSMELMNWFRSSIVIIPYKDPSKQKLESMLEKSGKYPDAMVVCEGVSNDDIRYWLKKHIGVRKILTTAEGIYKIIRACESEDLCIDWRNEFFCLFDEYHTIVTDHNFREVLYDVASTVVVQFARSSFMSASAIVLTDPVFSKYQNYHIEVIGEINRPLTVITTDTIMPTGVHFIKEFISESQDDEVVCVYINCVTDMVDIMNRLGEKYQKLVSIYCRKEDNNFSNLGCYSANFNNNTNRLTKINLFTLSYNQCWDLNHEKPTMVYLTNVHSPFTHQNIEIFGAQFIGRARKEGAKLFHITNVSDSQHRRRSSALIRKENLGMAHTFQDSSILEIAALTTKSTAELHRYIRTRTTCPIVKDYLKYNEKDNTVHLNHGGIECMSLIEIGDQQYYNAETVMTAWRNVLYNPVHVYRTDNWTKEEVQLGKNRKTKKEKREDDYRKLHHLAAAEPGSEEYAEFLKFKTERKDYWRIYELIGMSEIERLKFDPILMKKLSDLKENEYKLNRLRFKNSLASQIKVGGQYTAKELQAVFEKSFKHSSISLTPFGNFIKQCCNVSKPKRKPGTSSDKNDNAFTITGFKDYITLPKAQTEAFYS
ncbi:MAG TPA: hypothetical protein VGE44_13660 [Daejeonella sp.]|uniref:hypothetical protein n=1 Tax=Daejeonella sp. TaxID=2805397 RepID=UPI002EDB3303